MQEPADHTATPPAAPPERLLMTPADWEERGPRFERWRLAGYIYKCSACNYILRDLTEWTRHITQPRYPDCRNRPPQPGPHMARQAAIVQRAQRDLQPAADPLAVVPPLVVQPAVQHVVSSLVSAPRKRKHTCDCKICGVCSGEKRFTFITCDHTFCTECVDSLFQSQLRHSTDPIRRPRCPSCNKDILDIDLRRQLPEEEVTRLCKIELSRMLISKADVYGTACERCNKATVLAPGTAPESVTCIYCNQRMTLLEAKVTLPSEVDGMKWKPCPTCKAAVHHASGCNHMECHCGTHFCYVCGDAMEPGGGVTEHYMRGKCTQFPVSETPALIDQDWET